MEPRSRQLKLWLDRVGQDPKRRTVAIVGASAVAILMIAGGIAFAGGSSSSNKQTALPSTPTNVVPTTSLSSPAAGEVTTSTVVGSPEDRTQPAPTVTTPGGKAPGTTSAPNAPATPVVTSPSSGLPVVTVPPGGSLNQTDSGLSVSLTPSSVDVDPSSPVDLRAQVVDSSGGFKSLDWDFGDGLTSRTDAPGCDDPKNKPTVQNGQTNFPAEATHVYRTPGRYAVTLTATTGARCGSKAKDESVSVNGIVNVKNGPVSSNGPSLPKVSISLGSGTMPEDPHVGLQVTTSDTDGYISQIIVDWNDDGASPTVQTFPLSSCDDPTQHTPPIQGWPASIHTVNFGHDYLNAGTHSVTVTATSAGCDSTAPQEAIGVVQVTAGGTALTLAPS